MHNSGVNGSLFSLYSGHLNIDVLLLLLFFRCHDDAVDHDDVTGGSGQSLNIQVRMFNVVHAPSIGKRKDTVIRVVSSLAIILQSQII